MVKYLERKTQAWSKMKKCVSVVSGGIDSVTNGLMMLERGYEVHYIHLNYRQKCELGEKLACRKIVKLLQEKGCSVKLWEVDLPFFKEFGKGSALVDKSVEIPLGMRSLELSSTIIGELWVPARNVVFLAIASSLAEQIEAEYIALGCNQSETGYPDNTHEFLNRFSHMLECGTIKIHPKCISPEWELDKPHILKWGFDHGYGWVYKYTYSCDCEPIPIRTPIRDRDDFVTCGRCGCSMNRRFAFYVCEKLWGIKDNQRYADEEYFWKVYLPDLKKRCTKDMWMHKYLYLVEE